VILLLALVWSRVASAVLEVGGAGVRLLWQTPWGDTPGVMMEADGIESVRIGKPPTGNTRGEAVLVEADHRTIPVAQGHRRDELEWLRNCILAVLARS
jgi:hypothetical protein